MVQCIYVHYLGGNQDDSTLLSSFLFVCFLYTCECFSFFIIIFLR